MGDALMAAGLQHRTKADQIALDVHAGILNRIAHPRLGGQVNHPIRGVGGHQGGQGADIGHIELRKVELPRLGDGLQPLQAGPFEGGVVLGVEVVETHHPLATLQQPLHHGRTDEAGRPGDQNGAGHQARASRSRK